MYPTRNDISSNKRKKIIELLTPLLAAALDLKSQTKQAHWNVKGGNFIALHELFDKIASEVDEAADLIAERIIQLGGEAKGTVRIAAKQSPLKEYPYGIADGFKHADALSSAIAAFNAEARPVIDETDDITADMLTEIVRGLDKQLWFVEAHLGETAGASQRRAG